MFGRRCESRACTNCEGEVDVAKYLHWPVSVHVRVPAGRDGCQAGAYEPHQRFYCVVQRGRYIQLVKYGRNATRLFRVAWAGGQCAVANAWIREKKL